MYLSKFQKADINVSAKVSWHLHAKLSTTTFRAILNTRRFTTKHTANTAGGELSRLYAIAGIASINGKDLACTAIEHYSEAIKSHPDFIEAYYGRAHVYWLIDDCDKAIKDFTRVIEFDPDHAFTHIQRGKVYSKNGCSARAIDDFKRAIELGDNSARKLLEEEQKKRSARIISDNPNYQTFWKLGSLLW